ncbi:MAG: sigma-70 family RNA polymerase sigma factor [Pseudomonadales bacterium]|jgi:RNA polymerase sigma-70 factor (ECF subfamily)|nr:sigma-70 family RNA polymerase sigma factor [Pseudomonadales bacterium]
MLAEYRQATEQHRQRVYSFAYYSLRAKEDAEDVTQEVFIKLWQHWQKVDHGKLGAWLMRVARNAVIDHVRKQRPAQANLDHYADVDDQAGRSDEASEIDRQIFKDQLQLAIKSLDDPFRSIVVMRDVQGLNYADIQASLSISESQVKVYLHRGRRKLRANTRLRQLFDENLAQKSRANQSHSGSDQRSANDKGNHHG